jgi:hypothetical protein
VAEPGYDAAGSSIEVVPVVVISQVFTARPSSIPDIRDFVRRCLAESPLNDAGNREVGETVFRALLQAAGPTGSIQVAFRIFPEHVEVDVLHSDTVIQPPTMPGPPVAAVIPAQAGPPENVHGQLGHAAHLSQLIRPSHPGPAAGGPVNGGPAPAFGPGSAGQGSSAWSEAVLGGFAGPEGSPGDLAARDGSTANGGPVGAARPAAPGGGAGDRQDDGLNAAELRGSEPGPDAAGGAGRGGMLQPDTFAEWMSSALRREGLTQEAAARQLGVSVKTVSRWVGGATEPRMRDLRRIQELFGEVPIP